jgi:hypothetical protein
MKKQVGILIIHRGVSLEFEISDFSVPTVDKDWVAGSGDDESGIATIFDA